MPDIIPTNDMMAEANIANANTTQILKIVTSINGYMTNAHAIATASPLVIPARVKAKIISTLLRGGIKRSTILPCTFDINIEDELFINAF